VYDEIWSVAAPIVDVRGNVASAIGVAGPVERFKFNQTRIPTRDAGAQGLSSGARAARKTEAGGEHRRRRQGRAAEAPDLPHGEQLKWLKALRWSS